MIKSQRLKAARKGDLTAFNQLIVEIQDEIYNLISWLFPGDPQLEAITQKVILRIYQSLDEYRGGDFKLWILKTLVKECRPLFGKVNSSGLQNRSSIKSDLISLRPNLRLTLVLVELEGLDYRQAACVMGSPQWVIRRHLASARRQLIESKGLSDKYQLDFSDTLVE